MFIADKRIKYAWNQPSIPIVLRRGGKGEKLRVRIPFDADNRKWLQTCGSSKPVWISGTGNNYWELPKSWFNNFVNNALKRFGKVYIIQPYREQEKCAPACMNATGHECECSCMGRNHGSGMDGSWFEVSETFAFRSGERELACRLLELSDR